MNKLFFLLLAVPLAQACTTNAVTGRKQLQLFPESTLQAEAVSQYQSFLSENKVVSQYYLMKLPTLLHSTVTSV